MTPKGARATVLLLGVLSSLGPLSVDAYLPGLPSIAGDLSVSTSTVQLTVTACLVGLTAGQLAAGPLSDVLGRRRPLFAGLALYVLASVLCAVATDATSLVAFRALHGVAGAFTTVIAFACIGDRETGAAAARTFSSVMLQVGVVRVLAPLTGALLLGLAGWRAVFAALAVLSAAVLTWAVAVMPETLPPEQRGRSSPTSYLALLRDPALVGYTVVNGFVFGALFAYLTGSPFVLQDLYGMSAQQYGVVFSVNAIGMVVAVYASGLLARRHAVRTLLGASLASGALGSVALLVVVLGDLGLPALLAVQFAAVASIGFAQPNTVALALENQRSRVGTAAAGFGFVQFLGGGLGALLAGLGGTAPGLPTAAAMAGFALAAGAAFLLPPTRSRRPASAGTTPRRNETCEHDDWAGQVLR
ncbi:MFS transporter, DHA1 family, bicyclomycin/chloramphenicol resistance protein [Lentzea fradiae]|uniref:MFS transporter, DHA1 family, bicyclomycin/chloramphenicol resistance protein n=1 Tax=Lentzea fradiae TaxID=200378 RepID=A0A1G7UP07_9PSEU|nr:multidrug effflux MFS transporter [Lentzea fradiae]SDG49302.1 MFS transporter, DHA1 family, bicyclomycin/chloramphenicol resistance protein [Lentzea fradiae]